MNNTQNVVVVLKQTKQKLFFHFFLLFFNRTIQKQHTFLSRPLLRVTNEQLYDKEGQKLVCNAQSAMTTISGLSQL